MGWESVYCHAGSLWDGSLFTVINILVASRDSAGKDGRGQVTDWEVVMGMIGESRDGFLRMSALKEHFK